jgi:hypothetical protein
MAGGIKKAIEVNVWLRQGSKGETTKDTKGINSTGWVHYCAAAVFYISLDGRRPANLQTALVTWYMSASE